MAITQTQLIRLLRQSDEYYEWKKAVHIRDGFTCQKCGARNGRRRIIEADHVIGLAQLVKDHAIASLKAALACPPLWDTSNGRTLCHTCHEQTDSYPKQFVKPKSKRKNAKANDYHGPRRILNP